MNKDFQSPNTLSSFHIFAGSIIAFAALLWWQFGINEKIDQYLLSRNVDAVEQNTSDFPSINGILIDSKTKKPLQVRNISLSSDPTGKYTEAKSQENGVFEIWLDQVPSDNIIELLLQFDNGTYKQVPPINLKFDPSVRHIKDENIYSVGVIEVYPYEGLSLASPVEVLFQKAKVRLSTGTLAVRSDKTIDSPEIVRLAKNQEVKVLEFTSHYDVIGNKRGEWVLVQTGDHEGYVFDAYLDYLD